MYRTPTPGAYITYSIEGARNPANSADHQEPEAQCMLMLTYSAGLRVGELLYLPLRDLDRERMQVHTRGAKGKKDRIGILSTKTLRYLEEYLMLYRLKVYLFEGQNGGQYSFRSVSKLLKVAAQRVGIRKPIRCIRYGIHLRRICSRRAAAAYRTDLRYIQVLLGHANGPP
ncbi:tyrosine-type recombinase/integrase [Catalinimonas alkaloidigena]|uniref:tyrosine-type recombinase/integrase n=1 Tax=Catalinimonas alkaloidigena TaxID=1075417 RepID=UPI003977D0FC